MIATQEQTSNMTSPELSSHLLGTPPTPALAIDGDAETPLTDMLESELMAVALNDPSQWDRRRAVNLIASRRFAEGCATQAKVNAETRAELIAVLKDIAMGAEMMLQVPGNSSFDRYAREVKRVALAGIEGAK